MPIDSGLTSPLGNLTYFFQLCGCRTEKHSQIWARIFLKCPLWLLAAKLESAGTNFFYKKLNSNCLGDRGYAKVWL